MSVVVAGLNHKTMSVSDLESMTVSPARLPKALHDLAGSDHLCEIVVVSTCLRTEIYAEASRFHGAMSDIRNFLSSWSGVPPEGFSDHLYSYFDEAAVAHLFKVAAGLDSAVLGEGEILRQVGEAWEVARAESVAGPVLSILFRYAVEAGKRVRSETAIARGTTSLSHAAVALAAERSGSLAGKTTLLIGTGEMGEAMALALAGAPGRGELLVANRTRGRAADLAGRFGGRPVEWRSLRSALAEADVVLASTGSQQILLEASDLEAVMASRPGRGLLIVDLAVPRDVDPAAGRVSGVTLLDMDDLTSFADRAMDGRRRELPHAQAIIAEEVERYLGTAAQRDVAPLVAALFERGEAVRAAELARFAKRLAGLDPTQVRAVEALTRGIVAKLLHDPTVTVKAGAGTVAGDRLAQAMRQLFGL